MIVIIRYHIACKTQPVGLGFSESMYIQQLLVCKRCSMFKECSWIKLWIVEEWITNDPAFSQHTSNREVYPHQSFNGCKRWLVFDSHLLRLCYSWKIGNGLIDNPQTLPESSLLPESTGKTGQWSSQVPTNKCWDRWWCLKQQTQNGRTRHTESFPSNTIWTKWRYVFLPSKGDQQMDTVYKHWSGIIWVWTGKVVKQNSSRKQSYYASLNADTSLDGNSAL